MHLIRETISTPIINPLRNSNPNVCELGIFGPAYHLCRHRENIGDSALQAVAVPLNGAVGVDAGDEAANRTHGGEAGADDAEVEFSTMARIKGSTSAAPVVEGLRCPVLRWCFK